MFWYCILFLAKFSSETKPWEAFSGPPRLLQLCAYFPVYCLRFNLFTKYILKNLYVFPLFLCVSPHVLIHNEKNVHTNVSNIPVSTLKPIWLAKIWRGAGKRLRVISDTRLGERDILVIRIEKMLLIVRNTF